MSVVKLRDSAASKFGAMSGCVPSTPVSRMPTRTPGSPGCLRYDPSAVAWIIAMSHWRPASGSAAGCRPGRVPAFAVARSAAVSFSTASRLGRASGAWRPIGVFLATPAMAAWARTSRMKRRVGGRDGRDADVGVLPDDPASGGLEGQVRGREGRAIGIQDDVLGLGRAGRGRSGRHGLGLEQQRDRDGEREPGTLHGLLQRYQGAISGGRCRPSERSTAESTRAWRPGTASRPWIRRRRSGARWRCPSAGGGR